MKSDKKSVLTNSLLYTTGNILLKFFSFLLIPLYTAFLTPEQYGVVNLALGFINVFSLIIMGGLQYSVIRFYADLKNSQSKVRLMISTVLNSTFIYGFIGCILLLITHSLWRQIIFDYIPFYPIVFLSILISLVSAIYSIYQDLLRGMQQAKKSITLSYVFFFLLLLGNITTVVIFRKGAFGILLSTVIVNCVMTIVMLFDLIKNNLFSFKIDKTLLKELFKYSLPLLPHTLSYSVSNFFSRIIINTKLSTSMLGLYSLASQFGGVADVVSNSVQSAFQPWLYSKLNTEDNDNLAESEIRTLTHQLLWLYGLIYLIIGCFAKEAIDFMTAVSYHPAWKYVPFIIMTVAIKSPLYFYQNFMYYHKNKTKYVFLCTLTGCIIFMILVWFLTPKLGIYGTIISDMVALVLRLSLTKWILRDINSIYKFSNILYITVFSIIWLGIAISPSYLNIIDTTVINVMFKLFMIILYGIIILNIYKINVSDFIHRFTHKDK